LIKVQPVGFINQQDLFRLLLFYVLQAIDNFAFSRNDNETVIKWLHYFITTGGLDHLISVLFKLPQDHKEPLHYTVECLYSLLKIVSFTISICSVFDYHISRITQPKLSSAVYNLLPLSNTHQFWASQKEVGSKIIDTLLKVLTWAPPPRIRRPLHQKH